MIRRTLFLLIFVVLPLAASWGSVEWLHRTGAAGVMLGATSGASRVLLGATLLALLLRLYTMVVLPGVLTVWIAFRLTARR
jgi:hypothetical protein